MAKIRKPPVPNPSYSIGTRVRYGRDGDGPRYVISIEPQNRSVETGTRSSVRTPNFHSTPRRLLPMNAYSITNNLITHSVGIFLDAKGRGYEGIVHYATSPSLVPGAKLLSSRIAEVDAKARISILDKLKDQSVNLAQAFAERKQTVNLMTKSVNRIASAALAIRRGNLRHAVELFGSRTSSRTRVLKGVKASPRNLDNYWLEFQYGWRPLLSDIYGSAELIAKTYSERRPSRLHSKSEDRQSRQNYGYQKQYGSNRNVSEGIIDISRYTIDFYEESALSSRLAQTGISNPLLLAWELLPYSFVLDWFVPVGRYLSTLDATNGLVFKSGTVSRYTEIDRTFVWDGAGSTVDGGIAISYKTTDKTVSYSRSKLTSFPSASLPSFNRSPLGAERFTSALSLLTQAFKR